MRKWRHWPRLTPPKQSRKTVRSFEVPVVNDGFETDRVWLGMVLRHTRESGQTALFLYDGWLFAVAHHEPNWRPR